MIAEDTPHELIRHNIERRWWKCSAMKWNSGADLCAQFSQRFEVSGETAFCYVRDAQPLVTHLQAHAGLRYLHRPANLEDVFIKLTGREMRD